MDDPDPITLSALQHWAYCPRQCGLIHPRLSIDDPARALTLARAIVASKLKNQRQVLLRGSRDAKSDGAACAAWPRSAKAPRRVSRLASTVSSQRRILMNPWGCDHDAANPERGNMSCAQAPQRPTPHHCCSHGTPSRLPSILTPVQLFRNHVASAHEVICEQ